ncbi:MAG: hypothetical protein BWY11_01680 [Firmicutes bacterium ADurb.Bin182]|nr:MAG: hypothetical protein BWY11_01680 [Firmicutes bacterium ADurb.Bin182]
MITELQKLQRAKTFMDKLAEGLDPVTGEELPNDSVLNNVKLSRCFSYVADVLRRVIENGGSVGRKGRQLSIDTEKIKDYAFSDVPIGIIVFLKGVSQAAGSAAQIPATLVTGWLEEIGLLEKRQKADGKTARVPTSKGLDAGILLEERTGLNGAYQAVLYSPKAQKFILDNLGSLVNKWNEEHAEPLADTKSRAES